VAEATSAVASPMGFLDRVFPRAERSDAWRLLLGSLGIVLAGMLARSVAGPVDAPQTAWWVYEAIAAAAELVGLWVATFVALRFFRVPRTVVLMLLLISVVSSLFAFIDIIPDTLFSFADTDVSSGMDVKMSVLHVAFGLAVGMIGPVLGALTVELGSVRRTVDGFRKLGFEHAEESVDDLTPDSIGIRFVRLVGWSGQPLSGSARLAVWFALISMPFHLTRTVTYAVQSYLWMQAINDLDFGVAQTAGWVALLIEAVVILLVVFFAVRRFNAPRSLWLASFVTFGSLVAGLFVFVLGDLLTMPDGAIVLSQLVYIAGMIFLFGVQTGAALLGVHLATRGEVATISPPGEDEPNAPQGPALKTDGGPNG